MSDKTISGRITISRFMSNRTIDQPICIDVEDHASSTHFLRVTMTLEDFALALTGTGSTPCDMQVYGLDRVGKIRLQDKLVFEIPEDVRYDKKIEYAQEKAVEVCPEGWNPVLYFNSQDSLFYKDGKCFAQCQILKWIERKETSEVQG